MTRLRRVARQSIAKRRSVARLGCLGVRYMAHAVIMAHGTRLLAAALYADEYLVVQIKGVIG